MDVVPGGALEPDRRGLLNGGTDAWIAATIGRAPADARLFERALTHGSQDRVNYERLEFLGDRVLGLLMAEWLYSRFPEEPEGNLSKRINALVARATCAEVGRDLGVVPHIRMNKQARSDGATASDNVIGDVVEALIGALYLDAGLEAVRGFVQAAWGDRIDRARAPQHPKARLQEWAAAKNRRAPEYEVVEMRGPDHAKRFTIRVSIGSLGDATGEGGSKHAAETAAAAALLERLDG